MRPLPRLHAVTDHAVCALEDYPVRAAAIAAAGPAVALHARDRNSSGAELATVTARLQALARPPGAAVFVNARADLALALDTQGLQLGQEDPAPADVRRAIEQATSAVPAGDLLAQAGKVMTSFEAIVRR